MRKETKELALCGVMTAVAVVLLCLGGIMPFAMYVAPMLASIVMIIVDAECRRSYAWSCFAASAILGLMLGPDKECSLLFCVLGYYPFIYPKIQTIKPKLIRAAVKFLIFTSGVAVMYAVLLFILAMPETIEEFAEVGRVLMLATYAIGVFTFFVYDKAVGRMKAVYAYRRKKH